MKAFVFSIAIIIGIILQSSFTVFDLGVKPDFLLILVLFSALLEGPNTGFKIGLGVGLVEDIVAGKYFGMHILTKMLTGFLIGLLEPKIFKENYLVPVATVFLGTLLHEFFFILFGNIVGMDVGWTRNVWGQIIFLAVYQAVLAPFIYVPFYKIYVSKWFNQNR